MEYIEGAEMIAVVEYFIQNYGWMMSLFVGIGIGILGIFRAFNVFAKIESGKYAGIAKYVYYGSSAIISLIMCLTYLLINNTFVFTDFISMSVIVFSLTQLAYNTYENTSLRTWLHKAWEALINYAHDKFNEESSDNADE